MSDWFSSFTQQAKVFADSIAETIMTHVNEAEEALQEEKRRIERTNHSNNTNLLLPWETDIESRQILSNNLMEKIFSMSLYKENFLTKPLNFDSVEFDIDKFVPIALRLTQLDSNLATMHSNCTPKLINELLFWNYYYCRLEYLKDLSGINGLENQQSAISLCKPTDIIFGYREDFKSDTLPTSPVKETSSLKSLPISPINVKDDNTIALHIQDEEMIEEFKNRNTVLEKDENTPEEVLELDSNLDGINNDDYNNKSLEAEILKEINEQSDEDADLISDLGSDYENINPDELNLEDEDLEALIALELKDIQ